MKSPVYLVPERNIRSAVRHHMAFQQRVNPFYPTDAPGAVLSFRKFPFRSLSEATGNLSVLRTFAFISGVQIQ